jgi:hypothetical protein
MTKKTTRTRAEAKRLMWEYYRENREILPSWIREYREKIISLLALGQGPDIVFAEVLDFANSDT